MEQFKNFRSFLGNIHLHQFQGCQITSHALRLRKLKKKSVLKKLFNSHQCIVSTISLKKMRI